MFERRELATILAALRFWSEEISPYGPEMARPYLEAVGMTGIEPLESDAIERLAERLRKLLTPE